MTVDARRALATGATGLIDATVTLRSGPTVLREFTLLAEPSEILAVLGASGSGKSTLLRAIAGLEQVSAGRVLVGGTEPAPREQRDVGMVFQDSHLLPFLDAARNISFPLDVQRTPPEETSARVAEQAGRFGLGRVLRRRPDTLSRGETARVGLGRAMIRTPRAFLLDEPLAYLDAGQRIHMRQQLREVIGRAGVTTFHVTHDPVEAFAIGDRVAVLDAGRVRQVAAPREIYDRPADTRVAQLASPLGISLVPATLVASGGLAGYRIGERTVPTWRAPLIPGAGRAVLLGLRPEDVHEEPEPDDGTLAGVVRLVEALGPSTLVRLQLADGAELLARFSARTSVRLGERRTVGVAAAHAHVFAADTGVALAHPDR